MPNKRVLFIAPSAYPLGGVAVWLHYLMKHLPGQGWEPIVGLASGRWHDVSRYVNLYGDISWVEIRNPTGSPEGRRRALMEVIVRYAPDLVVGVNIADVYRACESLRRRGGISLRVVMALHGIGADFLEDLKRERGNIDAVIATNRLTCRLCVERAHMEADCVYYAAYGVPVDGTRDVKATRSGEPLHIAFVGRLDIEQKRIDTIPDVLRCLERDRVDFRMTIVGTGPMEGELRRSLAPWLATGRVEMLGAVAAERVMETVYYQVDALLVTSAWETGPIVIGEAMAAGVPVVTSAFIGSGLEDALQDGENCLIFPVGNAEKAARQLSLLSNSSVVKRLIEGGRQLVIDRYSVVRSVESWAKAFESIAAAQGARADGKTRHSAPTGRLDRLFGIQIAETLRRQLGVTFQHSSAGGEWPHSLSDNSDQERVLEIAAQMDKR